MTTLHTVYIMAFTPKKMDDKSLVGMCSVADDMLSAKDPSFAKRMSQRSNTTRMLFSNQVFVPTMHSPQTMQSTLAGWLTSEKTSFEPRLGDTFFPHGMRDSKGRENYVLFYFDFK